MTSDLSSFERRVLRELDDSDGLSPSGLAVLLEADPGRTLEVVGDLRDSGLVERVGFDRCQLTAAGRELVASAEC